MYRYEAWKSNQGLRLFCDVVTSVATLLESLRMRTTLLKTNRFSVESTRVGCLPVGPYNLDIIAHDRLDN